MGAHAGGVFALAASANGMRLATGGADGEVAIWQARGLVPEFRLRGSHGVVQTVAWHDAGKLLAAGDSEGNVRVWDLETRKSVAELHVAPVSPSAAWPGGRMMAERPRWRSADSKRRFFFGSPWTRKNPRNRKPLPWRITR